MKERTLQILRYLTLPCVFGCLTLSADDSDGEMMSGDKGHFISTYERVKGKEITPNAGPIVTGGVDMYIQADYILWHASQGGMEYVVGGGISPAGAVSVSDTEVSQGMLRRPHFKLKSGFKVGIGLDFDYDGWDMGLMYTWLHSHATDSFGAAPTGAVNRALLLTGPVILPSPLSTDLIPLLITNPTSGSANWRLHFNVLDLELGRNYFISPRLNLRPHFGLKGTWQTQHNNIQYVATGSTTAIATTGTTYTGATETYDIAQTQHYWGVGPRAGVDLSWLVTRNFCFFGDWSLSALWGQFKNSREDTSNVASAAGAALLTNYVPVDCHGRQHQLSQVLEMQIGLRYDYWFSDDSYRFRIAASWENQLWLEQNQFFRIGNNLTGDLSLQGFTLNVRFDF